MVTDHVAGSISAVEEKHRVRLGRWLRGTLIAMTMTVIVVIARTALTVGISA
ncbi:hypothetical protein ABZ642_15830 [Streptomyces sp. NPDC007157]|uniref:hypothetical protein n=1 Tax=Streptomyces sp. NPDC007157 TaxID=3154681 RepID=UPI0033CDBF9C